MDRTIWKFPIKVEDEQSVSMPYDSQLLHVGMQGDDVCIWALVNPSAHRVERIIHIFGTGHPLPDDPGVYVGTFMLASGVLVFHVFVAWEA